MPEVLRKINIKYLISGGLFLIAVLVFILVLSPGDTLPPAAEPMPIQPEPTGYYGSEDFMLDENGFMIYRAGKFSTGIDVSGYQGQIDWQKVKAAGIEFVFIKVGSRGTTEGGLYPDSFSQSYYEGAKAAGLQVGAYFFSQAITPEEAQEEARFALEQMAGWELDLNIVYDWEWGGENSRTTGLDKDTLTQCAAAFCRIMEDAGLEPMLYFNESQGLEQMELTQLQDYPFWLALYDGAMDFPHPIAYWQYSRTGKVDGIDGDVDLNICLIQDTEPTEEETQ